MFTFLTDFNQSAAGGADGLFMVIFLIAVFILLLWAFRKTFG